MPRNSTSLAPLEHPGVHNLPLEEDACCAGLGNQLGASEHEIEVLGDQNVIRNWGSQAFGGLSPWLQRSLVPWGECSWKRGRVQYLQCEGDPIQTILGSPSLPT